MHSFKVPGTEGYSEDAEWLIPRYESVLFTEKYRAVLHLLPTEPSLILDVGAGTGNDAEWLTKSGHDVVAVEPVTAFREAGIKLHPSPKIKWLDDSLPHLSKIESLTKSFDVVLLSAVWNHLAPTERLLALSSITSLLQPEGLLVMSLRHGPTPTNRRMFEVSADETTDLAISHGLRMIASARTSSTQLINRQAGVTWSWLVFEK